MHPGFPVLLLRRKEQVFLSVKTVEQSLIYVTAGQLVCSDVREVYFTHFENYTFIKQLYSPHIMHMNNLFFGWHQAVFLCSFDIALMVKRKM